MRAVQATDVPKVPEPRVPVHPEVQSAEKGGWADRATEFLIKNRWLVVVPVVLPLSKAYDTFWTLRHVVFRNLNANAEAHDERVAKIAAQLRARHETGDHEPLYTSRRPWQSVSVRALDYKEKGGGIDVDLHDILEVDLERAVIRVEPRVNMGQLLRVLLPLGYTLPVVPELDELTVSGLILGYGIESSSHKYGLFADTVRSVELLLGDGRVIQASPKENADLFYALPFSHGAHGILTAVELPIVACKSHVHITCEPVEGLENICQRFEELVSEDEPPAFVDAVLFDRDRAVIVSGGFTDLPLGERENAVLEFHKPWFYKHMESALTRGRFSEFVPLRDYYQRYRRSLYFHGELLVPFGNHPAFRYLLGWLMPPKVSLMRLVQTERMRRYRDEHDVVQDALVPLRLLRETVELFHREFECYPLWLCAHKVFRTKPQGMITPSAPGLIEEMFVDVGAWQVPGFVKRNEPWSGSRAVRNMERWLRAHHGFQCLYAVTQQTRAEFWSMFDPKLYREVRKKYGAEGIFMDVFDKVGMVHEKDAHGPRSQ